MDVSGTSQQDAKTRVRVHWKPSEDEKLRRLVEQYGPKSWSLIAKNLPGRSGNSCRLRWIYQLDPGMKRGYFSPEEEARLLSEHALFGNNWSLIAKHLPGRTGIAVRNQWHTIMKRQQTNQPITISEKGSGEHPSSNVETKLKGVLPKSSKPEENNNNIKNLQSEASKTIGKDEIFSDSKLQLLSLALTSSTEPFAGGNSNSCVQKSFHADSDRRYNLSSSMDNGDDQTTPQRIGTNTQQEDGDETMENEDIPFIDFLGVGK